jgi:SAM-dependent methyltransferase
MELRSDLHVEGIELVVRDETLIPVSPFDGRSIPFEDGRFDLALVVDVLHHAGEPKELIREAARVAGGRILLKDHVLEGVMAGPTLRFMDWVGNAGRGFANPEGYWRREQWREAFDDLGLEIDEWNSNVRLYPAPFDLVFGRSLHFIARLYRAQKASGAGRRPQ